MGHNLKDKLLIITEALPNGAAAVVSDPIDTQNSTRGDFVQNVEFKISAPALVVGDLANGETVKYDVLTSVNSDMSSPTVLIAAAITQTGAGGAGAAAATYNFRLPAGTKRYVAIRATNSGAGDASDKSLTFEALL